MKSTSELIDFYYQDLAPALRELEKEREAVASRLKIVAVVLILVACGILFWIYSAGMLTADVTAGVAFGGVALYTVAYKILTRNYVHRFKDKIIHRLIGFIGGGLSYTKEAHVQKATFLESQIFARLPDRFSGNDYVSGTIGKTRLEFSDLHAEYKTTDSRGRTHWHTIFKGLFFAADFNKHFHGITVILPDTAEKLLGVLGSWLQSLGNGRCELVKMDDPEFEKYFVVYGSDQIEARYILSPSLMERIVDFKKKTGHPLYISFVGSKIFVAIGYDKDLFEPVVFSSLLDLKQVMRYLDDLQLAIGIVEDLNLNARIWSKQ